MADDFGFGDVAAAGIDPTGFNLGVNTSFRAPEFNIPAGIDVPAPAAGPGFDANAMLSGAEKAAGVTRMGPPSGGGGGFGDFANIAKQALPWLQLGTTGLGAISGIQAASAAGKQAQTAERMGKVQAESARQAQSAAGPAAEFGARELGRAEAGKLDPAIEASIDQWKQAMIQKVQDYAARSGQGDSSWLQSQIAQIEERAVAMRASMLQQEEQLGLQGIGVAEAGLGTSAGAAGAAGKTATGEVSALDSLIASANAQLSKLSAGAA